jgi:hypothetical protein
VGAGESVELATPGEANSATEVSEAVAAVSDLRADGEAAENNGQRPRGPDNEIGNTNVWPDEMVEAAFIAEARERGEVVAAPPSALAAVEETDPKNLPRLDDLVKRLSPEVRETLDDLFRAKFVAVRRLPKKALNP